tara:strand:- start:513 stop:926 length:414 start_codon:yes stop_codon:yes gene_type:complete
MNSSLELCRGYISSRTFSGNWVPQHIQNTIIRNYCNINNLHYLLSSAEYSIENSYIVLKDIVSESKVIDGIVFYSIHQLPPEQNYRNELLKEVLLNKCLIYFCVEDKIVRDERGLDDLNTILDIHRVVSDLEPLSLK